MDGKAKLIAIDDSASMRAIIASILADTEYEVVGTAKSGEEGLARYKELAPDVVLLDIVMPGMSGLETLRSIVASNDKACVLMVSSLGTEEAVYECLRAGAKGFVQKPFKKEVLVNSLKSALDGNGGA